MIDFEKLNHHQKRWFHKQTILKSLDVEDYHLKESISVKIVGALLQEDILFNYYCACL